jgi:hypothetical protein
MKEEITTFETAKLAKEKGFTNFNCFWPSDCLTKGRPTQSLLQKWLREKHNIFVYVTPTTLGDNAVFIKDPWGKVLLQNESLYKNAVSCQFEYEKALEAGLQKALKLINNGN